MDINIAKQLNLFIYPVKDLMVTIVDGEQVKRVGWFHKVYVQIQNLETYILDITLCHLMGGHGVRIIMVDKIGHLHINLLKPFMEFKWQRKNYNLYGLGSLDHKVRITPSMEKEELKENLSTHQGNTSKWHKGLIFKTKKSFKMTFYNGR